MDSKCKLIVMAPVVPDPKRIRPFKDEKAFDAWLRANHARETEIWVRIYKKNSGKPSITPAEAIDVVLCWGWIDGIRKGLDDEPRVSGVRSTAST